MASTVGTQFYYYDGWAPAVGITPETPGTATKINGMMTKPTLPGAPTRIDSTSQEELVSTSVAGVKQLGDTNFQFKHAAHDDETNDTNYKLFKSIEGDLGKFGVVYPDGGAVEFVATPYVQRDATGVNALDTFTVPMFVSGDFDDDATAPTFT
jgi:hypothetical protein